MGQARRRGSLEQRIAQAHARTQAEIAAEQAAADRARAEHERRMRDDPEYAAEFRARMRSRRKGVSALALALAVSGWYG